jgi:hypothetical protein
VGEYARYQGDSEKSDSVSPTTSKQRKQSLDSETKKYNQKVLAMTERNRQIDSLDKFMSDSNAGSDEDPKKASLSQNDNTTDDDFDLEMKKIDFDRMQERLARENDATTQIEQDQSKWAGSGLEDLMKQEYQNPMERQKNNKKPIIPAKTLQKSNDIIQSI